jgi:hypothetical protein
MFVEIEINDGLIEARDSIGSLDKGEKWDKRDTYTYLDSKVKATHEGAGINAYLNPSVIQSDSWLSTIEQKLTSLFRYRHKYTEGGGCELAHI